MIWIVAVAFVLIVGPPVAIMASRARRRSDTYNAQRLATVAAQQGLIFVAGRPIAETDTSEDGKYLKQCTDRRAVGRIQGQGWLYTEYAALDQVDVSLAVLKVDLPRELPHLFFDSKAGLHRPEYLDESQVIHLEGNFDQCFTVYSPDHYAIDTLSFITPEVMEALIAAGYYNIEIVDNSLILSIGVTPTNQIYMQMVQLGVMIYGKLMNNITTYRDERLVYQQGRQTVTTYGEKLNGPKINIAWLGFFGAMGLAVMLDGLLRNVFMMSSREAFTVEAVYWIISGVLLIILGIYSSKKMRENRTAEDAAYHRDTQQPMVRYDRPMSGPEMPSVMQQQPGVIGLNRLSDIDATTKELYPEAKL